MNVGDGFLLKKSDAPRFFSSLALEMRLIAPRAHFGGDVMFAPVESPEQIVWDYSHDMYPPKRFVLPHFEDILRYENGDKIRISNLIEAPRQALVGVRSCDVKAVRQQERFYCGEIVDPYFRARLENTVLFSVVCNRPPKKECFCICCDSGPYLDSDFDVQLTDLGDRFLYEVGSNRGVAASEPRARMLSAAGPDDLAERRKIELRADSLFETTAYFAKAINFISADEIPDAIWEKMGETCFRCGACTNLCPVCTCFTVDDRAEQGTAFTRCRSWDSCHYAGFTREASGHNPRPTSGSRLKRRFFHKASYQYVMRDGKHGCVGCGRCVSACLTKLDVPTVLKRIRRDMSEYLQPQETKAGV